MNAHRQFSRVTAVTLMFALLATMFGQPGWAASGDADLRELSRYTLTLTDLRKYAAANAAMARHPKAEQEDDGSDDEDDGDDAESLDDMVKRIESAPEARKAIAAAGLTPRQFAVITMALFQASFAQFAIEQGADPAKVAKDAGVNPANIRFVKEHKAELEKLKSARGD